MSQLSTLHLAMQRTAAVSAGNVQADKLMSAAWLPCSYQNLQASPTSAQSRSPPKESVDAVVMATILQNFSTPLDHSHIDLSQHSCPAGSDRLMLCHLLIRIQADTQTEYSAFQSFRRLRYFHFLKERWIWSFTELQRRKTWILRVHSSP